MAEIVTTSPISAYDFSASMGWMLVASFSGELPDLWWALRVSTNFPHSSMSYIYFFLT